LANLEPIPVLDLRPEIDAMHADLVAAFEAVLKSGRFILGPAVEALEEEVADYLEVGHAVAVNSGTDALVIGLRALGLGPGDEVITTAFSFFAPAEAINAVGATPHFVDIDPVTFNLDPSHVRAAVGPRTAAVLPVHLFGHSAAMDDVLAVARRHGLAVVEDAAQAFGAEWRGRKLGTLGTVGALSFFPTKNLGGFGDGGMLATHDGDVAALARRLRAHGAATKGHNEVFGYNSRLDEVQAALLRLKLPRVDAANAGRRRVASRYRSLLEERPFVSAPHTREHALHVFHQYTVRIHNGRDRVAERLGEDGIATRVFYRLPLHHLPVYDDHDLHLPEAERAADEGLSLPIWPSMEGAKIERVAAALVGALG
jgi:dTDP-4-amino-4,6-dideoxygalactose transaminase